jgi:hypothetical protein
MLVDRLQGVWELSKYWKRCGLTDDREFGGRKTREP